MTIITRGELFSFNFNFKVIKILFLALSSSAVFNVEYISIN